MKLSSKELTLEFYEKVIRPLYPNLTLEKVREICYEPWKFTREEMGSGELPQIRLQHFGVFKVYLRRAKGVLNGNKKCLEKGLITQEQYNKYNTMIKTYIKRKENEN